MMLSVALTVALLAAPSTTTGSVSCGFTPRLQSVLRPEVVSKIVRWLPEDPCAPPTPIPREVWPAFLKVLASLRPSDVALFSDPSAHRLATLDLSHTVPPPPDSTSALARLSPLYPKDHNEFYQLTFFTSKAAPGQAILALYDSSAGEICLFDGTELWQFLVSLDSFGPPE